MKRPIIMFFVMVIVLSVGCSKASPEDDSNPVTDLISFEAYYSLDKIKPLVSNFGSSLSDTSVSRTESGNTVYIDEVRGNDSNDGLDKKHPKKTFLWRITASNQKWLIAAGSVLNIGTSEIELISSRLTMSVYDGNPESQTFGNEIIDQPNPFERALKNQWVTESEKNTKYFTIIASYDPLKVSGACPCIMNESGCDLLLRGAIIKNKNGGSGITNRGKKSKIRVEDCVFEDIVAIGRPDHFGGCAVRIESNTTLNNIICRCFFIRIGEDVIWGVNANQNYPVILTDSAIIHHAEGQKYSGQHADVLQMQGNPGKFIVRRCVIEHKLSSDPVIDDGDGTVTIGGTIVAPSESSDGLTGGLIEDCIIFSNKQIHNIKSQKEVEMRRVIGVFLPLKNRKRDSMLYWFVGGIETDCVWAILDGKSGGNIRYEGDTVNKTNVFDIINYEEYFK
jgi:hypothetical protein